MNNFFSSIFDSQVQSNVQFKDFILILIGALVAGVIISLFYIFTHKNESYPSTFPVTMIMLPIIVAVIIRLVGTNAASALSLAGAFSLVRFRTAPADSKDIAYVFFSLAAGLGCGIGYIGYSLLFTAILCVILLVIKITNFGASSEHSMNLRISIPENLNYDNLFDDILNKYTDSYKLMQVRTTDFGSVFEVKFAIELKKEINTKEFLDELRCRNGNLNIVMTKKVYEVTSA